MSDDATSHKCDDFNADPTIPLHEKLTLYLSGLGYLAREIMTETNATTFDASTTLEPKNGGMTVLVEVNVRKVP